MLHLPLIIGLASALVWAYLLLGRGGFWRITQPATTPPPEVNQWAAVVIPARDEAAVIGDSIVSLLHQTWPGGLHIFLVDDGSSDGTAATARRAAQDAGRAESLTIITGASLPPGWTGKLWAAQQGIECALSMNPAYVLLTDADVRHAANNVATLVTLAERNAYDLTSFMVKLRCVSIAEKLLVPAFVFFFFKLYPPAWIADPRRRTAGAAGGCMLLRAATLARVGGVTSIRHEMIDDCALARTVKRSGGRVWLGATDATESLRAYQSFAQVGRMIARTAFNQLQHSAALLVAAVLGMTLTYVAPVALLFAGHSIALYVGAATYLVMTVAYLPVVRFYRLNPLWALALPLAAVFYMGATLASAVMFWSGRGGQWKGRAQDVYGHASKTAGSTRE